MSDSLPNSQLKVTELLKIIAQKGDDVTFGDLYHTIWLPKKKATISSWLHEARMIEKNLLPFIGDIPIKKLTPKDVIPALAPFESKIPTLQRLCMRVNEIINYAMCADLVDRNTCAKMRVIYPHQKQGHMPTLPHSELPIFFNVLDTNDGREPVKPWFKLLVLYQLYSMGRCNEVVNLRWSWIDPVTNIITIPAEQMKGRRPHRIWLCPEMVEIFKVIFVMQNHNQSDFVFNFSTDPEYHVHRQYFARWLQKTTLGGLCTPHGLRSTGRTWLRDVGCPHEVGEDFLAHVYGTPTERAYIRSDYLELRKPYYQKWYDYLRNCWFMSHAVDQDYLQNDELKPQQLLQI